MKELVATDNLEGYRFRSKKELIKELKERLVDMVWKDIRFEDRGIDDNLIKVNEDKDKIVVTYIDKDYDESVSPEYEIQKEYELIYDKNDNMIEVYVDIY